MRLNKVNKEIILKEQSGLCYYCGYALEVGSESADNIATWDHKIPKSKGGTDDLENLVVACVRCNHQKSNKL